MGACQFVLVGAFDLNHASDTLVRAPYGLIGTNAPDARRRPVVGGNPAKAGLRTTNGESGFTLTGTRTVPAFCTCRIFGRKTGFHFS